MILFKSNVWHSSIEFIKTAHRFIRQLKRYVTHFDKYFFFFLSLAIKIKYEFKLDFLIIKLHY